LFCASAFHYLDSLCIPLSSSTINKPLSILHTLILRGRVSLIKHLLVFWQAHVRGYRVRKNYKVICWAVGILDKVVLRWRRKGIGLRGFRNETESIDEREDDDILKMFRKQKVDGTIDEAFSRVLSMVDSPDARQQYRRMLEQYRQAKVNRSEKIVLTWNLNIHAF